MPTRASRAMRRGAVFAGLGACGIAGSSFVLPSARSPAPLAASSQEGVALRGTFAKEASAQASGLSAGGAGAALCAAASAAAVARRHGKARAGRPSTVPRAAAAAERTWEPRLTDWSVAELAALRQTVAASPGPDASYTGPRYENASSITPAWIDQLIAMQEKGGILPMRDAKLMVLDVINILRGEQSLQEVSIPAGKTLTVCGDLHGQYWDFMNLLSMAGKPAPDAPFLFNGDFVDRGSWSIEVIMVLFAFKLKDPAAVCMNRGNHEMLETNILYGFAGECGSKYDMEIFDLFSEAFRNLPLCHLIDQKVLVLHAGLPGPDPRIWMPGQTHDPTDSIPMTTLPSLAQIKAVDRYQEVTPESYAESIGPSTDEKGVNDMRILIDMLWGDPRGGEGYGPSYRKGKGVYMFGPNVSEAFCAQNGLQCIIRSHEVKADGYRWDHPRVVTVFSAPNYLDTGNNKASFLKLSRPNPAGDIQIDATAYSCVPHPDLPPMHWQNHLAENYPYLLRKMKKKEVASFDEFGDSDFEGLMNFDEWEPEEAESFQEAFKYDQFGRPLNPEDEA